MATERLVDLSIPDSISILTTAESAAIVLPTNVCYMKVSSDTVVFMRFVSGGNGFRIPANWIETFDVMSLPGKSIYFYNATGGTAVVTLQYKLRSAENA